MYQITNTGHGAGGPRRPSAAPGPGTDEEDGAVMTPTSPAPVLGRHQGAGGFLTARFRNLSVQARLGLAFGAVTLLLVALACMSWANDNSAGANDASTNASTAHEVSYQHLLADSLRIGLDENSVAADYLGHASASGDLASFQADRHQFVVDYDAGHGTASTYDTAARTQAMNAYKTYLSISARANSALASGRDAQAEALVAQLSDGSIVGPVQGLLQHQQDETVHADQAATSSANRDRTIVVVIGLIAVALAVGLARLIVRSITRPLGEATRVLDLSANGDLRPRAEVSSEDELGHLARALNRQLDAVQAWSTRCPRCPAAWQQPRRS